MAGRTGRALGAVMVGILVTSTLVGVSAPQVGADDCPVAASGHWTGSGYSITFATPFTFEAHNNITAGGALTGSVSVNSGPFNPSNGTVACTAITFGTVAPASSFIGTLAPDGRSATGTYTAPGDSGTWSAAVDPYVLNATSTAQPSTIGRGGATSWVFEVENTGTGAATLVEAELEVTGGGEIDENQRFTVSQGTGCDPTSSTKVYCHLGTILPGAKANATIVVHNTDKVGINAPGTPINLLGSASSQVGGGTDDAAGPVTISVVAPAALPIGEASGIAKPGVKFETKGGAKATPANPITVVFKLPKKVAKGSTVLALSKAAQTGKRQRSIDGVSLMSAHTSGKRSKASGTTLGLPKIASVTGPSVPMSISRTAAEASTFCGGQPCSGDVVHLTNFSGYNDKKHPAKVVMTWDKSNAGRGLNSVIFKRGDATTATTKTLPKCLKVPKVGVSNTPCVSKKKLVSGGDVQFTLLVLSGDPKFGRR